MTNYPDLVLTQDNGELEIYKNTRGASGAKFTSQNKFVRMQVPTGYGFSIIKDIDHDGDLDFVKKDKDNNYIMLRNDGDFKFTEFTKKQLKSDIEYGWGTMMENTGQQNDLAQNVSGHQTWLNVAGPHKIYSNPSKNNNWIGVRLPNSVPYYNATVSIISVNDRTGKIRKQKRQNTSGSGLGNDPSQIMTFNLGKDNRVLNLQVDTIYDGNRWVHPRPRINMIATFRDMRSNNYTAKSRDEMGQLPLNKSGILGDDQFKYY